MMTKEQVEMIAGRYGIGISYVELGTGGFVLDTTGKVYASVVEDISNILGVEVKGKKIRSEYIMNEINLFAA